MRTFHDAKLMAKVLRQAFADRKIEISHSETLEIVAGQFGFANWNVLTAKIDATKNETGNMAGNGSRMFHKLTRVLAGLLFRMEILFSRAYE